MVLVIDNYDSFTYNLVDYIRVLGAEVRVLRNDSMTPEEMFALAPERVVISPGPSCPSKAGVCLDFIRKYAGLVPILGVCLGMQAIGEAFGGKIVRAGRVMHGKTDLIEHDGKGVFSALASPMTVVRYHSLAVCAADLPDCLEISARSQDGEIMGIRHRYLKVEGVQFHPESIMTLGGKRIVENFLEGK